MVRHSDMSDMDRRGYINSGFTNSISSFSLNTKEILKANSKELLNDKDVEAAPDLNDDSFLSDLEKDSGRGYNEEYEQEGGPPVMHGYCDRSFEKNILTFTNGETGTLSQERNTTVRETQDTQVIDGRQGKVL